MGFQHRHEAERFLKGLRERLEKFGLALHPDKTRLIARRSGTPVWFVPHLEFGRFAARRSGTPGGFVPYLASNRRRRGEGKPETFDFLGFTHMCAQTWKNKRFVVRRKTMAKRLRAKLREVRDALGYSRSPASPAASLPFSRTAGRVGRPRRSRTVVIDALFRRRHEPIPALGAWLRKVVQGYLN